MTGSDRSPCIRGAGDFVAAFGVSRETAERLVTYEALLRRWQKAVNLVAPDTLDEVWHRHFADSAQLLALSPHARHWLDLGSGGGFPGLVIAIVLANRDARVHLVESNARKCAFLAEVARETGAPVEIHQTRIESLPAQGKVAGIEIVTARALSPLADLLELAHPFFGPRTRGLFLKGRQADAEVASARARWTFEAMSHVSRTDPEGRVVEVAKLERGEGHDIGSTDE